MLRTGFNLSYLQRPYQTLVSPQILFGVSRDTQTAFELKMAIEKRLLQLAIGDSCFIGDPALGSVDVSISSLGRRVQITKLAPDQEREDHFDIKMSCRYLLESKQSQPGAQPVKFSNLLNTDVTLRSLTTLFPGMPIQLGNIAIRLPEHYEGIRF